MPHNDLTTKSSLPKHIYPSSYYSVYEFSGGIVRTFVSMVESDIHVIHVKKIGDWSNDTYLVKIVAGGQMMTSKLVIAH